MLRTYLHVFSVLFLSVLAVVTVVCTHLSFSFCFMLSWVKVRHERKKNLYVYYTLCTHLSCIVNVLNKAFNAISKTERKMILTHRSLEEKKNRLHWNENVRELMISFDFLSHRFYSNKTNCWKLKKRKKIYNCITISCLTIYRGLGCCHRLLINAIRL